MTASKELNVAALAFIGDAVYEVYARRHVMKTGVTHSDILHKMAVKYVSAEGQAKAVRVLMDEELTEEELALVKRARNHKVSNSKKARASKRGGSIMIDKYATAFETLLGELYLRDDKERLDHIVSKSFDIIEKG